MNTQPFMAGRSAPAKPAETEVAALQMPAQAIARTVAALAATLPFAVATACATGPLDAESLSPAELAYLRSLGRGPRRNEWLLGRAALAGLFAFNRPPPGSAGTVQQACWSLSHSGDVAIAVATTNPNVAIGVDIEAPPGPSGRCLRLFLTDRESRWLHTLKSSSRQSAANRLWALKEAAYKSVARPRSLVLRDFQIRETCLDSGITDYPASARSRCFYRSCDVAGTAVALAFRPLRTVRPSRPAEEKA